MNKESIPKFVVDVMLGSLSRWLRLFGFDTLYFNDCSDKDLIRISLQQDRILITKDNALARSRLLRKVLLIHSEKLKSQLKEVFEYLTASENYFFLPPRCSICNGETEIISKNEVISEVPEYISFTKDMYRRCKRCGKVYWYGTHMQNIEKMKKELFDELKLK